MTTVALDHLALARDFLRRSKEYLEDGDLHQASEKGWGAAAHIAKAIASSRGWEYENHNQFDMTVQNARHVFRQSPLRQFGDSAQHLHRNFYQHPSLLSAASIREDIEDVEKTIDALAPFLT